MDVAPVERRPEPAAPTAPATTAAEAWASLDVAWQEAFRQAWEALRASCIPVGAVASTPEGEIIHASRNRIADNDGPTGEIFGSALAHAEINVLARLRFRTYRGLILTTVISRIGGLGLTEQYEQALRQLGDTPIVDLALQLEAAGATAELRRMEVDAALELLWPQLQELCGPA